jgi:polyisoprenoid-binding protein YceI
VALAPGSHRLGPDNGSLHVKTYREGMAAKVGHDLVIEVTGWEASATVGDAGTVEALSLDVDPRSLHVREGLRGVKPLTDKDRADIRKTIDDKVLGGDAIAFRCSEPRHDDPAGRVVADGELTIAGTTRPVSAELSVDADGRMTATVPVKQTEWGIKPYRGLMGALKVRDDVEVVVEARLPVSG